MNYKGQILKEFIIKLQEINAELELSCNLSEVVLVLNQDGITKLINSKLSENEKITSRRNFIQELDRFKSDNENVPRKGYLINFELYEEYEKSYIYDYFTYEDLIEILQNLKYDFISLHFIE